MSYVALVLWVLVFVGGMFLPQKTFKVKLRGEDWQPVLTNPLARGLTLFGICLLFAVVLILLGYLLLAISYIPRFIGEFLLSPFSMMLT